MDLNRLEAFLRVYRTGSVTRAASEVFRSQPGVSYQIKTLENELGVSLFERQGPRLIATPQAAMVAEAAESILERVRVLRAHLGQVQAVATGTLRIASGHSVTTSLLWKAISRFRKNFPGIVLFILNETTDGVTRMVRRGQVDMGITSVAVQDGLVKCVPLHEYGYFLITGRTRTTPGFILPMPGTRLRRRIESELRDERPTVAEIASLEIVPDLVRAGVGQSILPGFLLPRNRKGLRIKRLAHMGTDAICSIRIASAHEYPAAGKFEEIVQKCFGSASKSRR